MEKGLKIEIVHVCFGPLSMKYTRHKMCDKTTDVCTIHIDIQHRLTTRAVQHSHI